MTPLKVKILLLEKGLTISGMAQILINESLVESTNFDSQRTMLTAILYGTHWYPTLAETVNSRFNLNLKRPAHLKTVREAIKQAA